ncbi:MAG: glycosyltransferase [Sandarakinorhabdus sp.]|nr:glycosyltransferase [Sandarakinorhabdus sp.]
MPDHADRRKSVLLRVSPWGGSDVHGGQLRSQQITQLVARALPDAITHVAPGLRSLSYRARAALAVQGAVETAKGISPSEGLFTAFVGRIIAGLHLARGDLVIYDADPRYGAAMARVAARRGLRLVALPHNVEAMIPHAWPIVIDVGQVTRDFGREVGWLAKADQVWTIGCFDRDLFQLCGIDARLLPYVPPAGRAAELAAIRVHRETASPGHLLILGTAHNPPTRAGMLEQLAIARTLRLDHPVILAGYGTEALAADAGPGVTVVGAQSWPELQKLIGGAAALWVHQAPMSGALTRIPEALIAGVPVVANNWAARGHAAMAGLVTYGDAGGLAACLANLPTGFAPPDFAAAEAHFINAMRTLVE